MNSKFQVMSECMNLRENKYYVRFLFLIMDSYVPAKVFGVRLEGEKFSMSISSVAPQKGTERQHVCNENERDSNQNTRDWIRIVLMMHDALVERTEL